MKLREKNYHQEEEGMRNFLIGQEELVALRRAGYDREYPEVLVSICVEDVREEYKDLFEGDGNPLWDHLLPEEQELFYRQWAEAVEWWEKKFIDLSDISQEVIESVLEVLGHEQMR